MPERERGGERDRVRERERERKREREREKERERENAINLYRLLLSCYILYVYSFIYP